MLPKVQKQCRTFLKSYSIRYSKNPKESCYANTCIREKPLTLFYSVADKLTHKSKEKFLVTYKRIGRGVGLSSVYITTLGLVYVTNRARIFKLLRSTRIDSKDSIPPAYVAWRAGTTILFLLSSQPP